MCQQDTYTRNRLSFECRSYERTKEMIWAEINKHQPETFSDNETEVDMEEPEDYLNNLPSPKQRTCWLWSPEYQARREARKRLWSPPLTPPGVGGPHTPYSPVNTLQPRHAAVNLALLVASPHHLEPIHPSTFLPKHSTAKFARPDRLQDLIAQPLAR
ncbi:MAG: hypothetical protein L6R40_008196 [Gallowayella cf. fulva]|nr:MAG: hypothetical protein L6R40_008196 [Xanthomendoza cf. fulva]